ncbi:hypothetical protein DCAR_0310188 [Daucus carota subsp. sativus]|uniref:Uncharacterized protein n=1 Tax=Daucus carota subsp. sativus TaxID=79200 RepID=A0A165ZNI8_DAUCS|nr:hypothetical protein DCAR_0310188 [Daucus carota subsp. sativus]
MSYPWRISWFTGYICFGSFDSIHIPAVQFIFKWTSRLCVCFIDFWIIMQTLIGRTVVSVWRVKFSHHPFPT